MVKIGDIIEIPLSDGQKAYCHYVFWDKKMGPLIQVFDLFSNETMHESQLYSAKPLFPPIITGLKAAVRTGMWKVIGQMPVRNFIYPGFVSTLYDTKTGKAGNWFLWNGEKSIQLGPQLPEKYKSLEYLLVWDPKNVIRRIETGEYPFPYLELIQKNEFIPETS